MEEEHRGALDDVEVLAGEQLQHSEQFEPQI